MTGSRQKIREAAIVLAVLALALVSLRKSARAPGDLSALDRGILTLIAPAQSGLATMAHGFLGLAGHYVDLVNVRSEIEVLRQEQSRLRTELIQAKRGADESARYQRLLGLRDAVPAATLAARVIAIDVSPYFRVARVQLDRGEGAVARGMPVLSAAGVVGRINKVMGDTSDIQLAVDPRSAIDVIIPRTGGRGILRGKPGENGYRCSIEYLVRGEETQLGDLVVTSGLGNFPRDVPVGRISRATKNTAGLYQEVEVIPDVNFAQLSEVLVVVTPAPAPDPGAGSRKAQSGSTRGLAVYR